MAITRPTITDDTGAGTNGTVFNAAFWATVFNNIDAIVGDWTTFTPTWTNLTVGNGTVVARWRQINAKAIEFNIRLTFGSTTSISGNVGVSTPATIATSNTFAPARLVAYDSSSGNVYGGVGILSTSTSLTLFAGGSPFAVITSAAPFAWATGDVLHVSGSFEAP